MAHTLTMPLTWRGREVVGRSMASLLCSVEGECTSGSWVVGTKVEGCMALPPYAERSSNSRRRRRSCHPYTACSEAEDGLARL